MLRWIAAAAVFVLILVSSILGLGAHISKLKSRSPEIDRATVITLAAKRCDMVRQVRGVGALVPETLLHLPAPSSGRVERLNVAGGEAVSANTVLFELKNLEMEQQADDAALKLQNTETELANLQAQIKLQLVNQKADLTSLRAQLRDTKLRNDRDKRLFQNGILLDLDYRISTNAVENLTARIGLEEERANALVESLNAQLEGKRGMINQLKEDLRIRRALVDALKVRAGVDGIVDEILVQAGQHVNSGADLAVLIQPGRLKAVLAIPERQAEGLQIGQTAQIGTANGDSIEGRISRIDPSVANGTRTIEVRLPMNQLPAVAPDQAVEGRIDIERIDNILCVEGPPAKLRGRLDLFKVLADGKEATRAHVRFGRSSLHTVEVLEGLAEGDRAILVDSPTADGYDRVRLK